MRKVYFHKIPRTDCWEATADQKSVLFRITPNAAGKCELTVSMPTIDYRDVFEFNSVASAKRFASIHFG